MDILVVAAASVAAYGIELAAQGVLPWGPEARGVLAVFAGAVSAIWITLRGGRSVKDLGFVRPRRLWTLPFWVTGILAAFVLAQGVVPLTIGAFLDLPQPDLSRYDFIRGNLPGAMAMVFVLPLTAAIPEEVLYRGFLIERLTQLTGQGRIRAFLAVLIQATIFGFVHFQWGIGGILHAAIMGIIWGLAFILCGRNLWIVILAHSAAHVALVTQLYFS